MKPFQRIMTVFLCLVFLLTACGTPGGVGAPGVSDAAGTPGAAGTAGAAGTPGASGPAGPQTGGGAGSAPGGADPGDMLPGAAPAGTAPADMLPGTAPGGAAPAEPSLDGVPAGAVVAMGRYVETEITPPLSAEQSLATMGIWPDGTLYCIACDEEAAGLYTTADGGETWRQRTALRFADIHPGGSLDARRFAAAPDGNVYCAYRLLDAEAAGVHLYRAAPDGACAEIAVDALQESGRLNETMWLNALRQSGDGRLLLNAVVFPAGQEGYDTGTHRIFVIDPETGRCEQEIFISGSLLSDFGQNGFYEMDYDGQLMYYEYTGGTGRPLGPLDAVLGNDFRKQTGARIAVLDEETHTFAALSHDDLRIVTPDGSFAVWYTSNGKNLLCRYVFDSGAPVIQAACTMTVWALNDSDTLRSAVAEFRMLHPEADIVLELGHTYEGDGLQDSDIITALNTRLIAGNAPDVLILDGLPVRGYIQKGALLNLAGLVEESDYFDNLLNAWQTDSGVWAYPTFAKLCVLMNEPSLELAPDSLAGLAGAAVQGPAMRQGYDPLPLEQQPLLATSMGRDLINTLYPAVSAQIFPDGAALNEDALREYYAAVAAIAQRHGITDRAWEYEMDFRTVLSDLYARFSDDRSRAAAVVMDGSFTTISSVAQRNAVVRPMPGNAYVPVLNAAVPAKAAQPDLAKEFIRDVLLGGVIQWRPGGMGLPISRSSFVTMQKEYVPLMEQAKVRAEQSVLLHDIVEENMRAILRGELSVDEAVTQTAAGVRLYFAEQS